MQSLLIMKQYEKNYRRHFGLGDLEEFPCEFGECMKPAHSIHHSTIKGMGGRKDVDGVEHCVGLCLEHHNQAHKEPVFNELLQAFAKHTQMRREWMTRKMMREL